jgi:hypothetical protein
MYVNPFFLGVVSTIAVEAVALIVAALTSKRNK